MSNQNQSNNRARVLFDKYKNSDNDVFLGYLIATAVMFNVSDKIIDDICASSVNIDISCARLLAIIIGVSDYKQIESVSQIASVIRKEEQEIIYQNINNADTDNDLFIQKFDNILDELGQIKKSSSFNIEDFKDIDFKNLIESIKSQVDTIASLKDETVNQLSTSNNNVSQCIDSLLELTECNISILEELYSLKEEITVSLPKTLTELLDKYFEKSLIKQEELFQSLDKKEGFSFKTLFSSQKKKNEILKEIADTEKVVNIDGETKDISKDDEAEKLKNYEEVAKKISVSPSPSDVFDVFEIIRTGVFNDEQVEAIKKGFEEKLTPVQILEFAKPENDAKTMYQLIDFLIAVSKDKSKTFQKPQRPKNKPKNITNNEIENIIEED